MPKTAFDKPKYPPVDWMLAAILERKQIMGLNWSDLADVAHISPETMRSLATKKKPEEWPTEVRRAVMRKLGLSAKLVISDGEHSVEL